MQGRDFQDRKKEETPREKYGEPAKIIQILLVDNFHNCGITFVVRWGLFFLLIKFNDTFWNLPGLNDFSFFLKRVGWSILSRRLDSWRSILLPITIKSSSPFRVAFKTLIPICLMLLRWFHNTIRLTFRCKVKKKIREIQMKKQMNKIKYTDLHIRFSGTQSSTADRTSTGTKTPVKPRNRPWRV